MRINKTPAVKRVESIARPLLSGIALGIPVFMLVYFVNLQPFGRLALSPAQCQLKKWNLPQTTKNISKRLSVLVPRPSVTCCEKDTSCLDNQLWGENEPIADQKGLITAIDRSLQYLQSDSAASAYKNYPSLASSRPILL